MLVLIIIKEEGENFSMTTIEFNGIKFELLSWDFRIDGSYGRIKFLVPKGIYDYGDQNGAYCWAFKDDEKYDVVGASCSCFQVNGHSEDEFMHLSIWEIAYAAANFINSLPKTEIYQADLDLQEYMDD